MRLHTKNEVCRWRLSEVTAWTGHTDRDATERTTSYKFKDFQGHSRVCTNPVYTRSTIHLNYPTRLQPDLNGFNPGPTPVTVQTQCTLCGHHNSPYCLPQHWQFYRKLDTINYRIYIGIFSINIVSPEIFYDNSMETFIKNSAKLMRNSHSKFVWKFSRNRIEKPVYTDYNNWTKIHKDFNLNLCRRNILCPKNIQYISVGLAKSIEDKRTSLDKMIGWNNGDKNKSMTDGRGRQEALLMQTEPCERTVSWYKQQL